MGTVEFTYSEDEVGRDFRSVEFARNTPHPTVGLLRTEMVERARHGQQVSGSPATCTLIELHDQAERCILLHGLLQYNLL